MLDKSVTIYMGNWLSLVMYLMVSFVQFFSPQDVLDEIWDFIESVSEDFPAYICFGQII